MNTTDDLPLASQMVQRIRELEAEVARLQNGLRDLVATIDRYDAVIGPNPPEPEDLLWHTRDVLRALLGPTKDRIR